MATVNLSRAKGRHKKFVSRFFTTVLDYTDEVGTSADVHQLLQLPPESMVIAADMVVITASDAVTTATADLGFAGGDELIADGNLKSAAGTVITDDVTGLVKETGGVVTFTPTYTGATTAGKWRVTIEYLEYTMVNGDVTNFVA